MMKSSASQDPATTHSILERLLEEAPKTLPILRQSCIQVLNLTQDKRSSARDIGEIIMRDQAMMANVIKIANSPAYHTRMPVKTPTYAVALIGFDVIRAMVVSAQLIEQADSFGANTSNLKHLLARALVAATQAPELGKAINYGEAGFLFTNAMLYSLGDLIFALCRSDTAEQLEAIRQEDPANVPKAELALLGRDDLCTSLPPPWPSTGICRRAWCNSWRKSLSGLKHGPKQINGSWKASSVPPMN